MDWFQRWPKEALIAVADHFLSQYDIVCSEEVKKQVIQTMGIVHDGVAECCVEYFQRCVLSARASLSVVSSTFRRMHSSMRASTNILWETSPCAFHY